MIVTPVEDDELLFRAVRADDGEFTIEQGTLRFTANAFRDKGQKPSVDRSKHRSDPRDTRFSQSDGITSIVTRDVRDLASGPINPTAPKENHATYEVDVIHRPLKKSDTVPKDNPAHCQIECNPEIVSKHFKKLKEALAHLATKQGWVVEPGQD